MKNGIHYQLVELEEEDTYLYSAGFNQKMSPQYRFTLAYQSLQLEDLILHNEFISTQKESPFTQNLVVKMATARGFMKLVNAEYSQYESKGPGMDITRYTPPSMEEYLLLLKEKFGIALPPGIKFIPLDSEVPIISGQAGLVSAQFN
jgi:arylamine N-acetyltransferase